MDKRASFNIAANVAEYGFSVIAVGTGECDCPGCCGGHATQPWAYTIGLIEIGHPELVVLGLDSLSAHRGLSAVAQRAVWGMPIAVGVTERVGEVPTKLLEIPFDWLANDPSRMAMWFNHYRSGRFGQEAPNLLQVVWSDDDGHFPDEDAFDPALRHLQPLLHLDSLSYPAPRTPYRNPARHQKKQRAALR